MIKNTIILALIIALIYFYYHQRKQKFIGDMTQLDQTLMSLLKVNSLEELKTKLGAKTLDEILEQNEDYETEVDTLTRTKNSLEQDLQAQSTAFQNRLREKERENKKLKEDLNNEQKRADNTQAKLTSEKQQHKGSIERISKLTEQITELEQQKSLFQTKANSLEIQLLNLAKQKIKGKKEAEKLLSELETNWNKRERDRWTEQLAEIREEEKKKFDEKWETMRLYNVTLLKKIEDLEERAKVNVRNDEKD